MSWLAQQMTFSPWTKVYFENVLVKASRGTKCIVFPLTKHAQVSLNLFPVSPLRGSHATLASGRRLITISLAWRALLEGKWHNLLHWDWNSVRAKQSVLIGRSRTFSGQSISDSSCTTFSGVSRPSLQSTRRATTSLPNVSNDYWPVIFGEKSCDTLQH